MGRIPVIKSASAARVASAQLPGQARSPSASSSSAAARTALAAGSSPSRAPEKGRKGKERARDSTRGGGAVVLSSDSDSGGGGRGAGVVDLTSSLSSPASEPDDLIIDDSPRCVGMIHVNALVTDPFFPVIPPRPPVFDPPPSTEEQVKDAAAALRTFEEQQRKYASGVLPVHIRYEGKTWGQGGYHEMLRLLVDPGDLPGGAPIPAGGYVVDAAGNPVGDCPKPKQFGFVDYNAADLLAPLLGAGWHGTGITRGGSGTLFCRAELVRSGELNPCIMKLRLILFSRPQHIPSLSLSLEHATPCPFYLDHPSHPPLPSYYGCPYANPHNPAVGVGGSSGRDAERRRQQLVQMSQGQRGQVKQVDVQREMVKDVFAEMKSGRDLEEVEPPPIVCTPLYPHQRQALSFLLDRESLVAIPKRDAPGAPPVDVSLFRRSRDAYGKVTWRSLVSDVELRGEKGPRQARGAILADDMGLGKTIVVISLVCSTLEEAKRWVQEPLQPEQLDARLAGDTLSASDIASAGRSVSLSEFGGHVWGLPGGGGDVNMSMLEKGAKKQSAKSKKTMEKKERAKEDEFALRFQRLECRSRGTLIVCPLSTVQNWESQFDEHTRVVEDEDGRAYELGGGGKKRAAKEKAKGKKRAARVVDSEEEDGDIVIGDGASATDDPIESASSASDGETPAPKRPRKKALSIYIYHGNARLSDPRKLADFDVVITTFSTLGTEFSKQQRAEEEREEAAAEAEKKREEEEDGIMQVYGFGANGEVLTAPPGAKEEKKKRKRKRVEGSGVSPLQAVQWFRVVLDEAHIIKEHKTIQARAACDLSATRRIALTGTPLQNNLNDIFSLIRFIRLEPFTDRHIWTQYIGSLAQKGEDLGTERLKLIMRYLALRRTKDMKDAAGKPILALPPLDSKLITLEFTEPERAFYASHHSRYKHDFAKLDETDSVMKNYCSILQELLKLRQICVHPALLQDSEDRAGSVGLAELITKHGISKPRAIQLIALFRDAQLGDCSECGNAMAAFGRANVEMLDDDEGDSKKGAKKPAAKKRKTAPKSQTGATSSGVKLEDDGANPASHGADEVSSCIVTRCQHIYCAACFRAHMCPSWPDVKSDLKAVCKVCTAEFLPALDAVEVGAREFQKALEQAQDERPELSGSAKAKTKKHKSTRLFEHSTKTQALLRDLLPFSVVNPSSANYDADFDPATLKNEDGSGGTIGFQPVHGEIVKSVVFSQWTTLLDRLGDALENDNIQYRRLDGAMSREARSDAMEAFKLDPATEVLLVSLRAGGVGLNLTAGRRVYLMEPYWNPAIENQAVDRIYRLGQTKSVQTVRFVMDKSIESNMLKIQKRKMDLANLSVGRTMTKEELARERRKELELLLED
ncbi:hypothetical protein JCM10213v2_003362 [Rhodosporidiobolus nylandii]